MPIDIASIEQLPAYAQELLRGAALVSRRAYNAYSGFLVGAAVRVRSGDVYLGTFLENASLGLTICAEAAAVLAANTAGATGIVAIAVSGGKGNGTTGPAVTPCGRCRQLLHEAAFRAGNDIEVYCANLELTSILLSTVDELLPFAFGPTHLSTDESTERIHIS